MIEQIVAGTFESELARGEKIPPSRFYRDYCARCKEPIRVPGNKIFVRDESGNLLEGKVDPKKKNYCTDCHPRPLQSKADVLGYAQRSVMYRQSNKDI